MSGSSGKAMQDCLNQIKCGGYTGQCLPYTVAT